MVRKLWRGESAAELKPKALDPPAELLELPTIAVMGRSNSGKSSCLNRLFGKGSNNRAKASSRHGKTTGIEVSVHRICFIECQYAPSSLQAARLTLGASVFCSPLCMSVLVAVSLVLADLADRCLR